jgi:hypothetical protein
MKTKPDEVGQDRRQEFIRRLSAGSQEQLLGVATSRWPKCPKTFRQRRETTSYFASYHRQLLKARARSPQCHDQGNRSTRSSSRADQEVHPLYGRSLCVPDELQDHLYEKRLHHEAGFPLSRGLAQCGRPLTPAGLRRRMWRCWANRTGAPERPWAFCCRADWSAGVAHQIHLQTPAANQRWGTVMSWINGSCYALRRHAAQAHAPPCGRPM